MINLFDTHVFFSQTTIMWYDSSK